ncbi:MAG TPA: YidB family protein [Gemmatimonadales bacterium]
MGMFDGIIGGVVGAEMATVVAGLIEKHGGVQGIAQQFESQGLGPTVRSWIGTGTNQPISTDQIHQVLGRDTVNEIATKLGMNPDDLAAKLAQALPTAVDRMTPTGVMPTGVYPAST